MLQNISILLIIISEKFSFGRFYFAAKIHEGDLDAAGLVAIAIAHGLGIVITVAATANISGGHVNPAVTFGLAIGGHITIFRGALYWIAQLLGSVAASYTLKLIIVPGQVLLSSSDCT